MKNLREFTLTGLQEEIKNLGIPKYRAEQIFISVNRKHAQDINSITGIPKELAAELSAYFYIEPLTLITKTTSKDNTQKFLFETTEAKKGKVKIESVLIREEERDTVCVSTQAGCNVGCEFCATGKMGLMRNLTPGEIVSQVYDINTLTGIKPTNLVFMGMGEPFLNYESVMEALKILTDKKGFALPSKRITVSTVGFVNRIKKFADDISENENLSNVKLALSLHTTDNGLREKLIPVSKAHKLSKIYEELIYFYRKTGNKITYEYIYFEGLNDTENDVKRLARLSGMIPCNINIIPFHPVDYDLAEPLKTLNKKIHDKIKDGKENSLSYSKNLSDFIDSLRNERVTVNLRSSSGVDINAACGQLAVRN
jgi:23S rRNA (adenine2503-C2)-methyltransferase